MFGRDRTSSIPYNFFKRIEKTKEYRISISIIIYIYIYTILVSSEFPAFGLSDYKSTY